MAATAIPVGLALGLSLGLLGGGGSVLAVPLLVYVVGEDVQAATTTSLLVVAVAAVGGSVRHARSQRVCWRHAAAFTVAAVPGIVAGTAAGGDVSERVLVAAFALLMLAAAPAIWRGASAGEDPCETPGRCPPLRLLPTAAAGAGIGAMTGFFGIGGGFLIVPTLIAALALPIRMAVGTSLSIIAATALIGLAVHTGAGRELDVAVTGAVASAAVLGAVAGSGLTGVVPRRRLAQAFASLVVAVAGYLLLSATVLGVP